jgi:serine/threonine protein kinase
MPAMRYPRTGVEALVGKVLGKYRLVQLLGSGGVGDIYLAEPDGAAARGRTPPPRVAVKVLRAEHRSKPDLVRRFEREAIAAARVRHPNVLEIVEAPREHEGVVYFAMELLVGLDLADTLAYRRFLPPARVVRIACGLAEGLTAVHAAGVVHRDVKPENVFLVHEADGREIVKLVDFGFAFMPGDAMDPASRPPRTAVGTPEYMAPEQAQGALARPTADVYSLGVVLYEMLSGRVPFSGEYPAIARRHASEPFLPLREACPGLAVSDELEAVVGRAMAKDPAGRFPGMAELRRALLVTREAEMPSLAAPIRGFDPGK